MVPSGRTCPDEHQVSVLMVRGCRFWAEVRAIKKDDCVEMSHDFIIIGGKAATSVEFFPPRNGGGFVNFPFLTEAVDDQMDNLYPYVHLLPNGHLFVFANNKSVLYDYTNNVVLKQYPELEGGPRNYPSAGSSVMLTLTPDTESGVYSSATILVCGGAQYGAFNDMNTSVPAQSSCGRIKATAKNPVWEMEDMPVGRIMGDMVMLPTGD
nr:hypothetical protein [Tanacetum cinerariifolium]